MNDQDFYEFQTNVDGSAASYENQADGTTIITCDDGVKLRVTPDGDSRPIAQAYEFWTDAGDETPIKASSLNHAAEIASRKISVAQWQDGAWGWVKAIDGRQMAVPSRG